MASKRPIPMGQGYAKLASAEDIERDRLGFTHPNLHRRIDTDVEVIGPGEDAPRKYRLSIQNTNSVLYIESHLNEDAYLGDEIP